MIHLHIPAHLLSSVTVHPINAVISFLYYCSFSLIKDHKLKKNIHPSRKYADSWQTCFLANKH